AAATLGPAVRSVGLPRRGGARGGAVQWVLCVPFGRAAGVRAVRGGRPADASKAPEGNKPTSLVTDQTAASGDVVLEAKGYIIPAHQVQVSPKIAGMLVWINEKFAEGQRFDEGELLAR